MKNILKRLLVLSLLPFMITIGIVSFSISAFTWILYGKEIYNDVCDNMLSITIKFLREK